MNWTFAKPELTQWLDLTQICFPDEDLSALITALHAEPDDVVVLMAQANGVWVAMGCLTQCQVSGKAVSLLGPIGVHPDYQGQGLGRNLVEKLMGSAASPVLVLGDPAFYGRFGFQAEQEIKPPYAIPKEWAPAWQSVGCEGLSGVLTVPAPWQVPAYWA